MKKTCSKTNSGSVLVGAMALVLAVACFLYCYLYIVQNSNQSTARAQRWNSALALAESGIEVGLANLNATVNIYNSSNPLFSPGILTNNLTIGINGKYTGSFSAADATDGITNTIISTGYAPSPVPEDTKPIRRTVKVTALRHHLITKGIVAVDFLDLTGGASDPLIDSWDSRLGSYQRNSHLNNGGVAVLNGKMDLANHTIAGNLYLGNDAYLAGNNFSTTGTTNYGWATQYPPASLPTNDINGNPLPAIWPDAPGTSQSHTFTNSGYYTVRDTGDLIVNAGVTVNLDVKVSSYDCSKSTISIGGGTANAGTLIIYQESGTADFGGPNSSGAIDNRPINFQYFGLPGVTAVNIDGGNSTFQGVIYAPQADLTMNGGGGTADNFMGGFVVRSLTDKGHYLIHYDQSLASSYYGYFVVSSWQEIPPPAN